MDAFGRSIRRIWYLLNRRRLERELQREMAAHRAQMREPRRFGNTTRLRDEAGEVWGWRWLDDLGRDLRYGARQLLHAPGFAATAILTLAIGIGANTAVFSVVNSLLLRPLPVEDPERLAILGDAVRESPSWSYPIWEQMRGRPELFDGAFAWSTAEFNLTRGGEARFVEGLWASGGFFDVLGVRPVLGRTFTDADDRRGGGPDGPVAVISHDFWRRHFGGSPDAIGKPLTLDAVAFTVIGVTPPGFFGPEVGWRFDVAVPIGTEPLLRGTNSGLDLRGRNWLRIMVRRHGDQRLDAATAAVRAIQPRIRDATLPDLSRAQVDEYLQEPFSLVPASEGRSTLRDQYGRALVVLLAIVGAVLLIACVNIANLMLARAIARRQEMSVRIAIGASRRQLARMLLAEASVLSGIGAVLGLALSLWMSRLLVRQLSTADTTVFVDLVPDWRVLAFATLLSAATAALFGAAPAWHSTRASPAGALEEQGRGRVSGGRSPIAATLIGAQLAFALVLVVGAGLFIRTFAALALQDVGFANDRVLVVNVVPPMTRYTLPQLVDVYERVREAIAAVPGVERAALSDITPVGGSSRSQIIELPGGTASPPADRLISVNVISPGWFLTYGTRLLAGRDVAPTDRPNTPAVALVNEAFARRFLDGTNPVGRTVDVGIPGAMSRHEIVGLVEDAVYRSLRDPVPPTLYTATTQRDAARPYANVSVLAAHESPALLTRSIAAAVADIDSSFILQFRPLTEQVNAAMNQERLVALLSGLFGGLALLLAGIGLYGVMAYAVSRRRAEIGLRIALGAARASVVRLVMRGMAWPMAIGIAAGALLSLWLVPSIGALVWGLAPRDPATFAGAAAILAAVGALAAWLPARRASRIDPAVALRE